MTKTMTINPMIEVVTFQELKAINPPSDQVVITVSKSKTWSKGLSPFVLGPCKLYGDYVSKNVENAWQFCKVYSKHIEAGRPNNEYFEWAKKGWEDNYAHRYPAGKGAKPEYSYWDGKLLDYVTARKYIYIPLYHSAVIKTDAYKKLSETYDKLGKEDKTLYLIDFDAYRHRKYNMSYSDVVNLEGRSMGHAFVLGMSLEYPEETAKTIKKYIDERDSKI